MIRIWKYFEFTSLRVSIYCNPLRRDLWSQNDSAFLTQILLAFIILVMLKTRNRNLKGKNLVVSADNNICTWSVLEAGRKNKPKQIHNFDQVRRGKLNSHGRHGPWSTATACTSIGISKLGVKHLEIAKKIVVDKLSTNKCTHSFFISLLTCQSWFFSRQNSQLSCNSSRSVVKNIQELLKALV